MGGDNYMLKKEHKQFCEEYVRNEFNGSKAYSVVYKNDNKNVCAVEAHRLLQDYRVQEYIKEVEGNYRIIGHRIGIDKKLIMKTIKSQLKATKPIINDGAIVDHTPDNTAINNAITTYAKLTGDFAIEKKEIEIKDKVSDVDIKNLSDKEREELKATILSEL